MTSIPPAAIEPAFGEACNLAVRLGARVTLVDVIEDLPSSAYNVFVRNLEADAVFVVDTHETELVIPFGN